MYRDISSERLFFFFDSVLIIRRAKISRLEILNISIYKYVILWRVMRAYTHIYAMVVCFVAASRIRYEITSGNIGGAFAVKNMTGAIYVAGALDYETRKRVSFIHNVYF